MNVTKLWSLAKYVNLEIKFQRQKTATGAHEAKFMEKLADNPNSITSGARMTTIVSSIFMLSTLLPAFMALDLFNKYNITQTTAPHIIFGLTLSLSIYYLSLLIFLLIFNLMDLTTLLKGDWITFLHILPLSDDDIQTLSLLAFIRLNFLQFLIIIVALPALTLWQTSSLLFTIIIFGINLLNLGFILVVMVSIGKFLSNNVFTEGKMSLFSLIVRIAVVFIYMGFLMTASILFRAIHAFIEDIFALNIFTIQLVKLFNVILSVLIFPGSSTMLAVLTQVNPTYISNWQVLATGLGSLLLFGVTVWGIKTSLSHIVSAQASFNSDTIKASTSRTQRTTRRDPPAVSLTIRHPMLAMLRKNAIFAIRDFSTMVYVLMPILFALFGYFTSPNPSNPFISLLLYSVTMAFMLNEALSAADEKLGALLSTLPYKPRDLFRARQLLISLLLGVPVLLLFLLAGTYTVSMILIGFRIYLLLVVTANLFFVTHAYFFGKINGTYTLLTIQQEHKTRNIITMFVLLYTIVGALYIAPFIVGTLFTLNAASLAVALYLVCLGLLELVERRMFQ